VINLTSQTIKENLQAVPLFRGLTTEELEPIVDISIARFFKQKMLIFMRDDPCDRVFFIKSGKIKIYKTDANGKEQIISILDAGEMFPHAGFFRKGNYPAHAEVIEDATLIVTTISEFEAILVRYPELCIKLFKVLGEKIVDLQARLEEQILHNTYEQIIMLLLRLCKTNARIEHDRFKLTTQFTNRELANMIGTTRETVSRTMNVLKKKQYITVAKDGCYLINHHKLNEELF
jgi:CRP-like cAMP-binding protein